MGRLVILAGPSCVGKGPLCVAVKKFYPDLAGRLRKVVLYDSRPPRPGEIDGIDYHFRSPEYIEALRGKRQFNVFTVRDDLQALDLRVLEQMLATSDVFFEGNPYIGSGLMDFVAEHKTECLSVFLSPLSREEISELKALGRDINLSDFITEVMRRKLLRRTQKHKTNLSLVDLKNIETRAASAVSEMQLAWRFNHVIVNHDGEDSDNWDAFYYPIADARRTLKAFAGLLAGEPSSDIEAWEPDLLG